MGTYNVRIEVQTETTPRTVIDESVMQAENEIEARKLGLVRIDSGEVQVNFSQSPIIYVTAERADLYKYKVYYGYTDVTNTLQETEMIVSVESGNTTSIYKELLHQFLMAPVVPYASYSYFKMYSFQLVSSPQI
jgi:hypothetical protein